MAYIGNLPKSTTFAIDTFNGDDVTTNFTLREAPVTTSSILVFVGGIRQHTDAYSLSSATLQFTEAPPTGTNNIQVLFLGLGASPAIPSDYSVTTNKLTTGAVTGDKVAATTITGDKIVVGTLTGNLVAATTITGDKVAVGTLTGNLLFDTTITGDKVAVGTLTGNLVASATITGDKIAPATIGSSNLTTTGVSSGSYGGSGQMPVVTVGTDGRVTYAANVAVATVDVNNITGNVAISGNVKAQTYQETFSNVSISSGNITCNLSSATIFKSVVTSAANVIFTSPPPDLTGFSFLIQLSQTGSYAITWPASIQWPSNTAPTLSTTAGYVDTIALYTVDGGTNYYGTSVLGQY